MQRFVKLKINQNIQTAQNALNNNIYLEEGQQSKVNADTAMPVNNPSFKSGAGLIGGLGNMMQGMQNGGFLVSFLVQDCLGMTLPRVATGFTRDYEVTGKLNMQEGKEVFLRESLSGPLMMAVAPAMMILAAKFGKSTNINTKLIKRYGADFKEYISKANFDKSLLNNKTKLKEKYLQHSIREMLENTLGKENVKDADIKYLLEQLKDYEKIPQSIQNKSRKFKKNFKKQAMENAVKRINDRYYETTSNLENLGKVKVGKADNLTTVKSEEALDSLLKYTDDVITNNKKLSSFTADNADEFMNKAVAKRFLTTISTVAATLGVLSVVPKIYAKSDVAPGAQTAMIQKENAAKSVETEKKEENNNDNNVSFKGKGGGCSSSILAKLGKFLREKLGDKFATNFEYDGHNFTQALMLALSGGGLLLPRGIKAYKRAQVDENTGKKDKTEIYEILIRDLCSSLSVVFAVPMLTRGIVSSYEDKVGFVLMQKDRTKTGFKKFIDTINPFSESHVLSLKELNYLYGGVNSRNKMLNFCDYINKNDGDLAKIFAKSEFSEAVFNKNTFELKSIENLSKKEKNAKIINLFKNTKDKKLLSDDNINKLMNGVNKSKGKTKMLSFAKGLNALPEALAMFVISPIILGWLIPELTYANTRRINAKKMKNNNEDKDSFKKSI